MLHHYEDIDSAHFFKLHNYHHATRRVACDTDDSIVPAFGLVKQPSSFLLFYPRSRTQYLKHANGPVEKNIRFMLSF